MTRNQLRHIIKESLEAIQVDIVQARLETEKYEQLSVLHGQSFEFRFYCYICNREEEEKQW